MFEEWLQQRTTVAQVEADFAQHAPVQDGQEDGQEDWRVMVAGMRPGDELWTFCSPPESWEHRYGRAGYAVVRDGEVVDCIMTAIS